MSEPDEGALDPRAYVWVQEVADKHFGGNWGRAAAAIIEAAWAKSQEPGNPWAEQEALLRARRRGQR